ncbi:MAG: hypothetical protein ABI439_04975 [Rhodospirillales bacterium]
MDGFSIWHGIGLLGLVLWIWPLWLIIARTGRPGALALLAIFPLAGLIVMWWLALSRWPAPDRR